MHHGIKCKQCFEESLVGYRYKCSQCNNYNLCQKCEEINSNTGQHSHDFIKIRKEQIIINNNNNNQDDYDDLIIHKNVNDNNNIIINNNNKENIDFHLINIEEEGDNNKYSCECVNDTLSLVTVINEGTEETKIDLILKNNGKQKWPTNAKLIYDKESQVNGNDINLQSQNPGEQQNYEVIFKNLNQLPAGEYKSFLFFFANGNPFGKEIILKIIIKQKNNQNEEMIQNIEKIKTIREILVLSENDYSDERILEKLKKVNYNVEEAIPLFFE